VDQRHDIYGLGATIYLAASGRAPYVSDSNAVTRKFEDEVDSEPLRGLGDDRLCELLLDMLRRDPKRRLPSWAAVLDRAG
jgi:serine/threonine protein kinase